MPEDTSAPETKPKSKGGIAIIVGGGKPESEGGDAGVFLPKGLLGEHFEGIEEGKEYTVTLKVKVAGKDDEGVDATISEVTDVDSSGDGFAGTESEDDMDSRFKKHAEGEDEGEDTPDGFAGGMKG